MKKYILFAIILLFAIRVSAQDDLFGKKLNESTKMPTRKGWLLSINGDIDVPAADMAKRFGDSYRIGPAIQYKTNSNWVFGVKFDFIMGNQINEDSFMINIKDKYGSMLDGNGSRFSPQTLERGYLVGLQGGRIFKISKKSNDNGILWLNTVGFMQHKINIFDRDQTIPEIRGAYKKGYDRLTNGLFVEEYVGYTYFAKNGLLNFHIGLDVAAGFTQGRRDYLFDVMRPDNSQRLDILFGLRGGWYIPIFKRKSEEYIFE